MILSWIALVGGLILLFVGGEALILGSVHLARHWGVRPLVIGLTVVALGTSAPELGVALSAALAGQPDITMGNVVGSNIANIGLVLAIGALVHPLPVGLKFLKIEVPLLLAVSAMVLALGSTGSIEGWGGLLLLATLIIYIAARYYWSERESSEVQAEFRKTWGYSGSLFRHLALVIVGIVLITCGAKLLVLGAVELARYFEISELVIGLTLTALGTSLPELTVTLSAARKGHGDIVLGNVVGSNLTNLTGVLGITSLITPISVDPVLCQQDFLVMGAFSLALLPVMRRGMCIKRFEGALLLIGYLLYIISILYR